MSSRSLQKILFVDYCFSIVVYFSRTKSYCYFLSLSEAVKPSVNTFVSLTHIVDHLYYGLRLIVSISKHCINGKTEVYFWLFTVLWYIETYWALMIIVKIIMLYIIWYIAQPVFICPIV